MRTQRLTERHGGRKEDVSGGLQKMSERSGGGRRIEQKL